MHRCDYVSTERPRQAVKPLSEQRFQSLLALLAPTEMEALKVRTTNSAYFMKFDSVAHSYVSGVTLLTALTTFVHSTYVVCTLLCTLALKYTLKMYSGVTVV
jgi:hypothetical protein